jgi:hypothetical protein
MLLHRPLATRPMVHRRGHELTTVLSYLRRLVALYIRPKWHIQPSSQLLHIRLQWIVDLVLCTAFPATKVYTFVSAVKEDVLAQTIPSRFSQC